MQLIRLICKWGSEAVLTERLHSVQANPLDPECEAEGKVVCSQGHIKGQPGTAPLAGQAPA